MDRSWMSMNRLSSEYDEGVEEFLNFAKLHSTNPNSIRCPCIPCGNLKFLTLREIKEHLLCNGIDQSYKKWIWHGESSDSMASSRATKHFDRTLSCDDALSAIEMVHAAYNQCKSDLAKFKNLIESAEKPLYPECTQFTKLSALVKLYNLKASYGWCDNGFSDLLRTLGEMLPVNNEIPSSMCEARKMLSALEMEYEKVDACPNDCILYRNEYKDASSCPTCGMSRWKKNKMVKKNGKKVPAKTFWHFPTIPRVKIVSESSQRRRDFAQHASQKEFDDILDHTDSGEGFCDERRRDFTQHASEKELDGILDQADSGEGSSDDVPKGRKTRGITRKPELKKKIRQGKKTVVAYNSLGQLIGWGATDLTTYKGMLARQHVPIIYDDWRHVPNDIKDKIWEYIEAAFDVDPKSKKKLLSSVGTKWKSFKSMLTTKYVLPFKNKLEKLEHPPRKYKFIKQQHWDAFVMARLSGQFKKLRQLQQERRGHNKFNHRLSRKGYAGLQIEIMNQEGISDMELDRSVLWKKARQKADGQYDEVVMPVIKKIDEMLLHAKEGKLTFSGERDILSHALGTPEHSDRVRGVGNFVTPRMYFHKLRNGKLRDEHQKVSLDHLAEVVEDELEDLKQKSFLIPQSVVASSNVPQQMLPDSSDLKENLQQKLNEEDGKVVKKMKLNEVEENECLLFIEEEQVAMGSLIEDNGVSCKVLVELAIKDQALLPIPTRGELITVEDAVGAHVLWPRKWVEFMKDKMQKENPQIVQLPLIDNPPAIKMFSKYISKVMGKDKVVLVDLEEEIFGKQYRTYLGRDDMDYMVAFTELSGNCIVIYTHLLFKKLKEENLQDKFTFINPASISISGVNVPNNKKRVQLIAERLMDSAGAQFLFIPYNPGFHWVLLVIHIPSMIAYYLDPLRHMIEADLENIVNTGYKAFQAQCSKVTEKRLTWKIVECPRQPGLKECGYYVLRYMKDIIADDSLLKSKFNGRKTYFQEEIDEVRCEWAQYVHMEVL